MSFLAPYMLWGALAASIPVILHFFFRSRYRRVPWAAMSFLLASIEQTSRRLRFQELLLLLARMALLAAVALALARPSSAVGPGNSAGDPVDAVLLIDNSASMDGRDGSVTRLEQAQTAAESVLDQLPAHSTVQVVTCADRAVILGPRNPADLDGARELVRSVGLTHLATDFLPGATEAAHILQRGQSPAKELYLFSDMHKLGWEQQGTALAGQMQDIGRLATVYLVRCGTKPLHNVGVVDIVAQAGIPHTGERAGFTVLVRNSGTLPLHNLSVSLSVDGDDKKRESQPLADIGPGETRAVGLTARLDRAGLRVLTATVKNDDLDADNRFDQVISVREQVRTLVVDGAAQEQVPEKSASYFLLHALMPVKETERPHYFLQSRLVTPRQAAATMLADRDLCILCNAAVAPGQGGPALSRDFLEALSSFVREGHGLLIFGGDAVTPEAYNQAMNGGLGLLPGKLSAEAPAAAPFRLDRTSAASSHFAGFREDEYFRGLGEVEVRRRVRVTEDKDAASEASQVLLRYSDSQPAVVTRRVGVGEVMLVTTSADLSWNDWPLRKGMYVPFVSAAVNHLLHGQEQVHNLTVGGPLRWNPPERDAGRPFALLAPDGRRTRLGTPEVQDGRPMVTTVPTRRAGVYRLIHSDGAAPLENSRDKDEGVPFAVVPNPRETEDLGTLTDAQLSERLGFTPVFWTAGAETNVPVTTERLNHEWTLWFLGAAVLIALFETCLAWVNGRAW